MTASQTYTFEPATDDELRQFVEESVSTHRGRRSRIKRLERKLHDYQSSFVLEHLDATFEDGTRFQFILKDLSAAGLLEPARKIRSAMMIDASREIDIYREVLAGASLGTATCYGAVNANGRHNWLLLEMIDGEELYQIGDFEIWQSVARWLARMHDRLADTAHNQHVSLHNYDRDYWHGCIERAMAVLRQRAATRALALADDDLNRLEEVSRIAANQLSDLPNTFVHGEFYASNILIQQGDGQTRICPIDWETAGSGAGVIDLVALAAGNWSEAEREALAAAYFQEASGVGTSRWGSLEHLAAEVNVARLLLAMKWIGWCDDWEPPIEHRFDWLEEARRMSLAIDGRVPPALARSNP